MTVQKGMGFYHVGAANTNRIVTIQIVASTTDTTNSPFVELFGSNQLPPFTDEVVSPTSNQLAGAYRLDFVARTASIYAVLVGIRLTQSTTANGTTWFDTVLLKYETAFNGVISGVSDISDTLGLAGGTAKTKSGIQTLETGIISTASLDGGNTLLFSANPNLADGTVTTVGAITALTCTLIP